MLLRAVCDLSGRSRGFQHLAPFRTLKSRKWEVVVFDIDLVGCPLIFSSNIGASDSVKWNNSVVAGSSAAVSVLAGSSAAVGVACDLRLWIRCNDELIIFG